MLTRGNRGLKLIPKRHRMSLHILLVDDHWLLREGLRSFLQARYPEAAVIEADSGASALERAQESNPDLIIVNLHLPDQGGLEVSRQILGLRPSARIILLSGERDLAHASRALQIGVSAWLLSPSAPEEVCRAISAALAGTTCLCPQADSTVLEDDRRALGGCPDNAPALSIRELEVLGHVANGLRSKEIATRLELTAKTVETYRQRLLKKFGCGSAAEMVRCAIRHGFIQP